MNECGMWFSQPGRMGYQPGQEQSTGWGRIQDKEASSPSSGHSSSGDWEEGHLVYTVFLWPITVQTRNLPPATLTSGLVEPQGTFAGQPNLALALTLGVTESVLDTVRQNWLPFWIWSLPPGRAWASCLIFLSLTASPGTQELRLLPSLESTEAQESTHSRPSTNTPSHLTGEIWHWK